MPCLTGARHRRLAEKAAEEVANYEQRIATIERDLMVLKWMVGTNVALTLLVLGKVWA